MRAGRRHPSEPARAGRLMRAQASAGFGASAAATAMRTAPRAHRRRAAALSPPRAARPRPRR
ncbi:hypothetical protein WS81_20585 [Burkholderia sp. MSMB2040]|nr:hypothetical protein WS81_20585 [Burkholderia sp. MSMB2040]